MKKKFIKFWLQLDLFLYFQTLEIFSGSWKSSTSRKYLRASLNIAWMKKKKDNHGKKYTVFECFYQKSFFLSRFPLIRLRKLLTKFFFDFFRLKSNSSPIVWLSLSLYLNGVDTKTLSGRVWLRLTGWPRLNFWFTKYESQLRRSSRSRNRNRSDSLIFDSKIFIAPLPSTRISLIRESLRFIFCSRLKFFALETTRVPSVATRWTFVQFFWKDLLYSQR